MALVTIPIMKTLPIIGSYQTGDTVMCNDGSVWGTEGAKYVLWGWKRATTGNSHILNVDWFELRAMTGG